MLGVRAREAAEMQLDRKVHICRGKPSGRMQNGQNGIRGFLGKSQMQAQNENVFIVLSVSGFRL